MIEDYEDLKNEEFFVIVNKEHTRHRVGQLSTYLDHWLLNCPTHVDNVKTVHGLISEHDIITMLYHTEELVDSPTYAYKTNFSELTRENLMFLIITNEHMN